MKKLLISVASAALVSIAAAERADAAPIQVAFNIAALGSFTADTASVEDATTITNGNPTLAADIVMNNIGLAPGDLILLSPNPMGVTVGSVFTKSFTTSFGTFVETLTVTSRNPTTNALGVLATGTISCGGVAVCGFDDTTVFWSAAYTQNSGPGAQINASFNNSTVPPQVPEPTSMVLLGLGLLGAGFARRRFQ